jgi:hypothetical protein
MFDPAPTMARTAAPSRQHYDDRYPLVLEHAGLSDSDYRTRAVFEQCIRKIFNSYWAARERPTVKGIADALDQYLKGQAMVRDAMQSLDLIHSEIAFGASLADLPDGDREQTIEGYLEFRAVTDHLTREEVEEVWGTAPVPRPDLDALIQERDRGIAFLNGNPDVLARLLKRKIGDYRKDTETALVIDPALDLLDIVGFAPSKKLTRKAFFHALFDLLGIEEKRQPTVASINVAASNRKPRRHKPKKGSSQAT